VALVLVVTAAGGGFCPLGITMGVAVASVSLLSLSLPESDFNCGGQSTDVGGQLSAPPDPDDPGGEHPAPAPKSPAVVQSALATAIGRATATSEIPAAASHIRHILIS
jgi:hypothetical protein